jgi:phosphatidylglycerophosphate synthase
MEAIQAMREVCQLRKPNAQGKMVCVGLWINRLLVRRFSVYITWLFVRIGITANTTTFFTILCGLTGVAFCIPHIFWLNVIGAFLLMLELIFDCVDGEIARWTKKSSLQGLYLDLASHLLCNALLATICALHLYLMNGQIRYLLLAFVAYIAAQCRRGLTVTYDQIILPQIPPECRRELGVSTTSGFASQNQAGWMQMKWSFARFISKLTDFFTIRMVSFLCIFLSYLGTTKPLILAAWFFAIFGILWDFADIVFKFFYLIPQVKHVKRV